MDGITPSFFMDTEKIVHKANKGWQHLLDKDGEEKLKANILQSYGCRYFMNEIVLHQ